MFWATTNEEANNPDSRETKSMVFMEGKLEVGNAKLPQATGFSLRVLASWSEGCEAVLMLLYSATLGIEAYISHECERLRTKESTGKS